LYTRKVHETKFFGIEKLYNVSFHVAQLKNTNDYLQSNKENLSQWLEFQKVIAVTLDLASIHTNEIVESWILFPAYTPTEDQGNNFAAIVQKVAEEAKKLPTPVKTLLDLKVSIQNDV